MIIEEELARLRKEARKLRQENSTLEQSRDAQKTRAEKLKETVRNKEEAITKLKKEVEALEKENNALRSRLGIAVDKAKKFAGMIFKSNVRKRGEGKPGSKRGAKKGHTGHGKPTPERIDREIEVFLTNCNDCGTPLDRTSSVDQRTVEDIPNVVTVVTRYCIERQWCTACHKEVRALPSNTIPGCRFGTGVITTILFLKYRMRAPLAKIEELLLAQHGITITSQGIQELLHNVKTKFSKQYNDILEEFRNAPVKHADETSFRIDGMNGWCWLFATPSAALYTIEETRGKEVPQRIFGHDPTGILVRDDYAGYAGLALPQQSCWAHLLRVSHEASAHEHASVAMRLLHEELKALYAALYAVISAPFDAVERQRAYQKYSKQITAITLRTYADADAKAIQTRIANQGANLITALLHENAPLTNNHAERMIRPMVITRKISGGSRSNKGAATHAVNMSVVQTLTLKGKDFFSGVSEILHAGNKRYALGNGG
jgi:transposase